MKIDNFDLNSIIQNLTLIKDKKTILIEKGLKKESLIYLNDNLLNLDIKLVIVCDPSKGIVDDNIRNLDVLNYLTNINQLSILVNSSKELDAINEVDNINDLKSFSISGNYSKKINIEILNKFSLLETFEVEDLDDVKKYKFFKSHNFSLIAIDSLDLLKMSENNLLLNLKINKELKNEQLLATKFKFLKTVELLNCKKISDFDFLYESINLENLTINYTNIEILPKLPAGVRKVQLLVNKRLHTIDTIFELYELQKFAITDSSVKYETIKRIPTKKLSNFYFRNKDSFENSDFESFSRIIGFENSMLGF